MGFLCLQADCGADTHGPNLMINFWNVSIMDSSLGLALLIAQAKAIAQARRQPRCCDFAGLPLFENCEQITQFVSLDSVFQQGKTGCEEPKKLRFTDVDLAVRFECYSYRREDFDGGGHQSPSEQSARLRLASTVRVRCAIRSQRGLTSAGINPKYLSR